MSCSVDCVTCTSGMSERLDRIVGMLAKRADSGDPQLEGVIDEIELRASLRSIQQTTDKSSKKMFFGQKSFFSPENCIQS